MGLKKCVGGVQKGENGICYGENFCRTAPMGESKAVSSVYDVCTP